MAFVEEGGEGVAVWGVGGGGVDDVDCSLPAGRRVSREVKVARGGGRCILGQVLSYPVGVLLLKLGHDDDLVAGYGRDGRGSDLSAMADEGHDVY